MAEHSEDIVIDNFEAILDNADLRLLATKIKNCKSHELSGKLTKEEMASCKATEATLWKEMEKQVTEKILPEKPDSTEKDKSSLAETMQMLGGYIETRAQIENATRKVLGEEKLMTELKNAGREARRNPTEANLNRAEAAAKAVYDKAESFFTVPKSEPLRDDLIMHLNDVMGQILQLDEQREEQSKPKQKPKQDKDEKSTEPSNKEKPPSRGSSPVWMYAENHSKGNFIS